MDVVIILFTAIIAYVIDGLGTRLGGEGESVCTPSSNTVELEERITNLHFKIKI